MLVEQSMLFPPYPLVPLTAASAVNPGIFISYPPILSRFKGRSKVAAW
jgi:hypothetical protein